LLSRTEARWRVFRKGLSRRWRPEPEESNVSFSFAAIANARARPCAPRERHAVMLRPDYIYFAMTLVKHGTLAGAFIFAFKILRFAIKTL
jgi:hypothetical protein